MNFSEYIQLIGRGRNSGGTLTIDQAKDAMTLVLNKQVLPEQLGAFLMLLRVREETPEELTGFIQACREKLVPHTFDTQVDIDVACYAGKRRQLPWFLLSAACLVHAGKKVFIHGTQELESKRLYVTNMIHELGLNPSHSLASINQSMQQTGAAYADIEVFHRPLFDLLQLRSVLGLRSCANTLARLLNPSGAGCSIQGVHHRHVDIKHSKVNEAFVDQVSLVFRGDGGDPEIKPLDPTELFITQNGETNRLTINQDESSWAMKQDLTDTSALLDLWHNDANQDYGLKALLSTLCAYLITCESLSVEAAQVRALELWHSRPRQSLPFANLSHQNCAHTK